MATNSYSPAVSKCENLPSNPTYTGNPAKVKTSSFISILITKAAFLAYHTAHNLFMYVYVYMWFRERIHVKEAAAESKRALRVLRGCGW